MKRSGFLKPPSLLTPIARLGVPKTTICFDSSLEGLTVPLTAVILTVIICYSERTHMKISQGKRYMGQTPQKFQMQSFSCPLPVKSGTPALLETMCYNRHTVLSTKEIHLSFGLHNDF